MTLVNAAKEAAAPEFPACAAFVGISAAIGCSSHEMSLFKIIIFSSKLETSHLTLPSDKRNDLTRLAPLQVPHAPLSSTLPVEASSGRASDLRPASHLPLSRRLHDPCYQQLSTLPKFLLSQQNFHPHPRDLRLFRRCRFHRVYCDRGLYRATLPRAPASVPATNVSLPLALLLDRQHVCLFVRCSLPLPCGHHGGRTTDTISVVSQTADPPCPETPLPPPCLCQQLPWNRA